MSDRLRVYVACAWDHRDQAKEAGDKLEAAGYELTAKWWEIEEHWDPGALAKDALRDCEAVIDANLLILLNTQKRSEETSGKAVEFGIALALLKGIIIVGEPTNIFHYLNIKRVGTIDEAVADLVNWEPLRAQFKYDGTRAVRRST